jgi:hypothetical protein
MRLCQGSRILPRDGHRTESGIDDARRRKREKEVQNGGRWTKSGESEDGKISRVALGSTGGACGGGVVCFLLGRGSTWPQPPAARHVSRLGDLAGSGKYNMYIPLYYI